LLELAIFRSLPRRLAWAVVWLVLVVQARAQLLELVE
jgi:hypothetical protein